MGFSTSPHTSYHERQNNQQQQVIHCFRVHVVPCQSQTARDFNSTSRGEPTATYPQRLAASSVSMMTEDTTKASTSQRAARAKCRNEYFCNGNRQTLNNISERQDNPVDNQFVADTKMSETNEKNTRSEIGADGRESLEQR
jgi:hypothetical protein